MKKYENRLDTYELRALCIRENWFHSGTNEQYEKLFQLNETGAPVETLAVLIWTCTDGAELDEITVKLHQATTWPIHLDHLDNNLQAAGWGAKERKIIREALETHPDAGIAYRLMYSE